MEGLPFATCCTQLGSRPIGITDADKNSSGNVADRPTESVVSVFFVFRATNKDRPDQAISNRAAKMKERSSIGLAQK